MLILGLNAYHGDASAALLVDGKVVSAVEEERFTRLKHQAGFPAAAVRWCLESVGARPSDIDHVAISRNPRAHLWRKGAWAIRHGVSVRGAASRAKNAAKILGLKESLADATEVDTRSLRATIHQVEHHRAHLSSAFFCSPFPEAACVSLDGMGDFVSTMWGRGQENRLSVEGSVLFPSSLGVFYTAFTQFLGLPHYGDEYKLMGMAAYGEPTELDTLRRILILDDDPDHIGFSLDLRCFLHHDVGVTMTWDSGSPTLGRMYSERLIELFGPPRSPGPAVTERDANLAASVQARLEEVELELLRRIHRRASSNALVLAGGVALNCVVNGRIRTDTGFENVWVQPAANDAGTAIGAALWVWNQMLGEARTWEMTHAYLGPSFDESACKSVLDEARLDARLIEDKSLFANVARRIADGAIVGWYQGATEFGPRALGNRSIVCDPRRGEMKDILNARIKHRESFRPFAPSVLADQTGLWFEQDAPSPFMAMAYLVRPERRAQIPAVTHEDGTSRLQTVARSENRRYYDLIDAFRMLTGVPVVLNTSFNENEPIVCGPKEAADCFLRSKMDVLVLGNWVVDRSHQTPRPHENRACDTLN